MEPEPRPLSAVLFSDALKSHRISVQNIMSCLQDICRAVFFFSRAECMVKYAKAKSGQHYWREGELCVHTWATAGQDKDCAYSKPHLPVNIYVVKSL